ncbi:MAG: GNAT family N-acetyltransferase [Pyrinomonadaceae bacterium]|nr:GNAT family N-acetyltransferase [Pyrinomonadaceae bacterium]
MPIINIHSISPEETRPLRRAVLRPDQSPEESIYPGDDAPDTLHLGAYLNGETVGVASLYHEPPPGEDDETAWRLRGMAILPQLQRQGYGKALLERCLAHVSAQGGITLWCNARTTAAEFYRASGFEVIGEEYELPGIGMHYMMRRRLADSQLER